MKKKYGSVLLLLLFAVRLFAESSATLNLLDEAKKMGAVVYWDSLSGSGVLEKNGHQISFRAGDSLVLKDYTLLSLVEAPELKSGTLFVSKAFLSDAEAFFKTQTDASSYKIGAILIDPGHGGKDPGAMDTHTVKGKKITVTEKDVNLAVGKMLYTRLKAAYPDKQILMTRSTDVFISLAQRTEIANSVKLKENEAILYVSIHVNASLDKKANGYEVWYLTEDYRRTVLNKKDVDEHIAKDKDVFNILNSMTEQEFTIESQLIAKLIMDGLQAQIGSQASPRGIKAEEWFVVRNSNMPAVLVELGFLTNEKEALLLADTAYLQKAAFGIYNGLAAFVTHFERSRGFTGIK